MSAGLAPSLLAPSVAIVPRFEPYLVEVILPFPLGAADQAVAEAAAAVERLLADPDLTGTPTAPTADVRDEGRQIANTAFVQAVARAVVEQARDIAAAAITDLLTKPHVMRSALPTAQPDQPGLPWLDGNTLVFTGED